MLHLAEGRRGSADLCAYFFLRAMQLVRPGGTLGLLAVNTIAEGDTRQVGLEAMLRAGHEIYAAWPNFEWPGVAAVAASEVHLRRKLDGQQWRGGHRLSDRQAPTISAFLSAEDEWSPKSLKANNGKSFQGSIVLGMGFTLSEFDAKALIARNSANAEALFPYLNGEDLNTHPEQKPSRWIINFWDWPLSRTLAGSWTNGDERQRKRWLQSGCVPSNYPGRVAEDFPDLLSIVTERVKPERDNNNRAVYRINWWHFAEKRPALYHAIGLGSAFARHPEGWTESDRPPAVVFAQSRVSKYIAPCERPSGEVWADRVILFAGDPSMVGLLLSSIHEVWVRKNASTFETRLTYTPSDAFDTHPFPVAKLDSISNAAASFLAARRQEMLDRNIGLTDVYNLFHDPAIEAPGIVALRALHVQLDLAVCDSYGWTDLDLGHGFHTVSYLPENDRVRHTMSEATRLEVLRRLSHLNRERWQAEHDAARAAIHDVEAARKAVDRPRRESRPALKLVADPKQPGLF